MGTFGEVRGGRDAMGGESQNSSSHALRQIQCLSTFLSARHLHSMTEYDIFLWFGFCFAAGLPSIEKSITIIKEYQGNFNPWRVSKLQTRITCYLSNRPSTWCTRYMTSDWGSSNKCLSRKTSTKIYLRRSFPFKFVGTSHAYYAPTKLGC